MNWIYIRKMTKNTKWKPYYKYWKEKKNNQFSKRKYDDINPSEIFFAILYKIYQSTFKYHSIIIKLIYIWIRRYQNLWTEKQKTNRKKNWDKTKNIQIKDDRDKNRNKRKNFYKL